MTQINSVESSGTLESTETQQSDDQVVSSLNLELKAILLLQFQPQYEILIMISIYISIICALLDLTFAYSTAIENIPRMYSATYLSKLSFHITL